MKKAFPILIAIIVLAALIALVIKISAPMKVEDMPDTDPPVADQAKPEAAADFTVYDANNEPITLSSMKGKLTVVNFWATWCGYCVIEMPDFEQAYKTYGDRVNFMMVDLTSEPETPEKAADFIAEQGYTFPVYYDLDMDAYQKYSLTSIPRTLIISEDGELIKEYSGAINKITLYSIIEASLSKSGN